MEVVRRDTNSFFPAIKEGKFDSFEGVLSITVSSPGTSSTCTAPPVQGTPSTCIMPGFEYAMKFTLVNPVAQNDTVVLYISSSYTDSVTGKMQSAPQELLTSSEPNSQDKIGAFQVVTGADILRTYKIGQLNPSPGQENAICVTLNSYVDIKSSGGQTSAFTITGLPETQGGAERYAPIRQTNGRSDPGPDILNVFGASPTKDVNTVLVKGGVVSFFVAGGDSTNTFMKANTDYRFCFLVLNPEEPQACAVPQLTLQTDGATRIYDMQVDRLSVLPDYGLGRFSCPGLVSEKRFLRASIRQSSNATGVESVFLVEILTNAEMAGGSSFTITGLKGYATASNEKLPIAYSKSGTYDTDKTFGQDVTWEQQEGVLVFRIAASKKVMPRDLLGTKNPLGDLFEFSFKLRNGQNPQAAMPVCYCLFMVYVCARACARR